MQTDKKERLVGALSLHASAAAHIVGAALLFAAGTAFSQCDVQVAGRVLASDLQPIAGATVAIAEEQSSIDRQRPTTAADGTYQLKYINVACPKPRNLTVAICAPGFKSERLTREASSGWYRFDHTLEPAASAVSEPVDLAKFQRECMVFARQRTTKLSAVDRGTTPQPSPVMSSAERAAKQQAIAGEAYMFRLMIVRDGRIIEQRQGGEKYGRQTSLEIEKHARVFGTVREPNGSVAPVEAYIQVYVDGVMTPKGKVVRPLDLNELPIIAWDGPNGEEVRLQVSRTITPKPVN